jgi:hypothetical protein
MNSTKFFLLNWLSCKLSLLLVIPSKMDDQEQIYHHEFVIVVDYIENRYIKINR